MDERKTAAIFKALGDENRIRILQFLRNGEKCACKLLEALDISQPTLSHHMRILCDSGIVSGRKQGKWMHYSISAQGSARARQLLQELTTGANIAAEQPVAPEQGDILDQSVQLRLQKLPDHAGNRQRGSPERGTGY